MAADNYDFTAGTGTTAAADEIGGVKFPRAKLIHGADGTNDGDVSSANPLPVIAGANSGVDIGDVDVTSVVPGTSATSLGKAEDAIAASGDTGVMALGVRQDIASATAADGDYIPLSVASDGALRTILTGGNEDAAVTSAGGDAASNASNGLLDYSRLNVFNGTTWDRLRGDTTGLHLNGNIADNGADSGNPTKVGGVYNASAPTYADGDRADLQMNVNGFAKVTLGDAISIIGADSAEQDSIGVNAVWRTDSGTATITSADASSATAVTAVSQAAKRIYLTDLIISVDTAMSVQIQDDAGSPAVMMEQIYLPANSVFSKSFTTPIRTGTNQDVNVLASTSGNISVTVGYYKI